MWEKVKNLFRRKPTKELVQAELEKLRKETPVPVFWLFGKTQSGKTSLIKFLTGADEAEIGQGFKPCTRTSRQYQFPTSEAPLLTFIDTRGMDEAGYDPKEDLKQFDRQAHVVIVTIKATDHALHRLHEHLRVLRQSQPTRPVLLVVTCLHEAYPQQQHPTPYPFVPNQDFKQLAGLIPENLVRTLTEQKKRFEDLFDVIIPVDLTRPEEGYADPNYGGQQLKSELLKALPAAYRHTLIRLDQATRNLQDLFARKCQPYIYGYSSLAATAGAIPIPWLDLAILPGIQTQMMNHLAQIYGQPLSAKRFGELASTLGMGMVVRQAVRELMKFIPYVGSVAGAALAGAATYALGQAFCYYYGAIQKGHVPKTEDLRNYYNEQLALAEKYWRKDK